MATIRDQLQAFKDNFWRPQVIRSSTVELTFTLDNAAILGEVIAEANRLDLHYEAEVLAKTTLTRDSITTTTTTTVKVCICSPLLAGPL